MISNLDGSAEVFLASVGRIQQNLTEANQQVSSGLKIAVASDAPDQIAPLLQLRADRQHNTQIQSNLVLAQADASSADDALSSAIQLMDRARTLATQASGTSLDASGRASIGDQVQSIQEQMVALANTAVQGRYIFSGDQDQSPAYQISLGYDYTGNGVSQLSAAGATRQVEDPAGGAFSVSQTAQQIFDSRNADGSCAPGNVFASLNSLRLALQNATGSDTSAIVAAAGNLTQASAQLNSAQSFYGGVENRIQGAQTYATNRDTQLQTQIGGIQDADVAAAALELTQANTQLSAAFHAQARMPTKTLFDYLA